ncbi:MAG TPA: glycosyltransferase family 9 protein [Magnetospirillum sp.]|jgi:hypothetical protein|nr:glycosyltransferase family 9 protein [Magnetospirillum sp.]
MTDLAAIIAQAQARIGAGCPEDAETMLRPLLAGGSGPIPLWAALATSLRHQGRAAEALTIQEKLVEAVPGNLEYRFNLAETLLLFGQFDRGWREYHHRYGMAHTAMIARKVQRPRWDGRPIPGKTLLIHDEQGFGDTLQFIRLVEWAKARSQSRVVLEVTPQLLPLAARGTGFDEIVPRGSLPPAFDVHCEMMSLPMVMGFQLSQLPGKMPYLSADPARRNRWRKRLKGLPRPLVALAWAGRPTLYNGQNRAVSLDTLAPLAMEGVTFLSIQKGEPAAQAKAPPPGMSLVNLSDDIQDFEDTAAILSEADLLISIDSAPAHLAGALGRPVWTMLGFVADWRWLLDRTDSPWYPSMRLFRQEARGDWAGVVDRVAEALAEFRKGAA